MLMKKPDKFQIYYYDNNPAQKSVTLLDFHKHINKYIKTKLVLDIRKGLISKENAHYRNINNYLTDNYENVFRHKNGLRYDLKTLESIYRRRTQCSNYNPLYAKQMTVKYINNMDFKISPILILIYCIFLIMFIY